VENVVITSNAEKFALTIASIDRSKLTRVSASSPYFNIGQNNVSVRDGYSREDYNYLRPEERDPLNIKAILRDCNRAYKKNGIVRNVIDLMSDFAVKGISINHPTPKIERFYKRWFKKVCGTERSERFLNLLYRLGNVIVKRSTYKTSKSFNDELSRVTAAPDLKDDPNPDDLLKKGEIPIKYTFLNPISIHLDSYELAPLLGSNINVYSIQLPTTLTAKIANPETDVEKELVKQIPLDIRNAVKNNEGRVVLDNDKLAVYFYKKDDWDSWASPMLEPILTELVTLDKMKLADISALDGAISSIRVWTLGDIENDIYPSEAEILKLAEILNNNVGGGVMDLVWGPAINLKETSTEVYRFLGNEKYIAVLNAIYGAFGIPPTLIGGSIEGGFSNNFISLKTLVERLNYGREMLKDFWEKEAKLVQKSMGFARAAKVSFEDLLTDEAAQKQLLINMWDRNLITDETFRDIMGFDHDIELSRQRREESARKRGKIPPKASAFSNPKSIENLIRQYITTGNYAPSEFGIELEPRKNGEKAPNELTPDVADSPSAKGQPGQGRPPGSKDKVARKKNKVVKPRTTAFIGLVGYAEELQSSIAKAIHEPYLKRAGKANLRELSEAQFEELEQIKFKLMFAFNKGEALSKEAIGNKLKSELPSISKANALLTKCVNKFVQESGKPISVDIKRRFNSIIYAMMKEAVA
jgi:hypothetical protein